MMIENWFIQLSQVIRYPLVKKVSFFGTEPDSENNDNRQVNHGWVKVSVKTSVLKAFPPQCSQSKWFDGHNDLTRHKDVLLRNTIHDY